MFKKVTTVISQNKETLTQKALVLGGITAGMIISGMLSKAGAPAVIVREEVSVEPTAPDLKIVPEEEK